MRDLWTYPITTPYGYVPGYPLNGGFHRGEDRAAPLGTPIPVNGITIGLVGSTGASTGNHCHIGRFVNGTHTPPGGQGATLSNPVVQGIGYDASNGNYVRVIDDKGVLWVYLHMSKVTATTGQKLQGGSEVSTVGEVEFNNMYIAMFGPMEVNPPTDNDRKRWIGAETNTAIRQMQADPRHGAWLAYIESLKQAAGPVPTPPAGTVLTKGNYTVL